MLKLILTLFLFGSVLVGGGTRYTAGKKGFVDVYYLYRTPSYVKIPSDRSFPIKMQNINQRQTGFDNLFSTALRFRAWTIFDDLIVHPTFIWSLNKNILVGNMYTVEFSKISKYEDLVIRYNPIQPTSVSGVVGMGIHTADVRQSGAYAWFRIEDNDLIVEQSEKPLIN